MSCFPCFSSWFSNCREAVKSNSPTPTTNTGCKDFNGKQGSDDNFGNDNINAHAFTFHELAIATKNFRRECLLGNGGFGRVYRGTLQSLDQVVAVKQLDRNGNQGSKEFLAEVLMLSLLHHPNLLNFIGYCAHGDQRLLVHEYMPQGSLEYHLHDMKEEKGMEWFTRMKIALGAARGLEHLHVKANPPVIYQYLKSSNILLDSDFNPKLSDFGLVDIGPTGDHNHVSSRVMGTYGYCAPEYVRTGKLTLHSDIYSFGVVMLELITGRRALDTTRIIDHQNLVSWAQPMFRDPRRFHELVDPLLKSNFPERGLNQAVAIAAMCLQDEASARPLITDVVTALSFISVPPASDSDVDTGSSPRVMGEEDHYSKEEGRRCGDEELVHQSESRRRWSENVKSEGSSSRSERSSSPSSSSTSIEQI